jgi:hypothetical protein
MFSQRTPLEGIVINTKRFQNQSTKYKSLNLRDSVWIHDRTSNTSNCYLVFTLKYQGLRAYRVTTTLPSSITLHHDIDDTVMNSTKQQVFCIQSCHKLNQVGLYTSGGSRVISYVEHGSMIYLFVAGDVRCDGISFNTMNNQMMRQDVVYSLQTTEFQTNITAVRPFYSRELNKILALIMQSGEDDRYLSLVELNVDKMEIVKYLHKHVLRKQAPVLHTVVAGEGIVVAGRDGMTYVTVERSKTTQFNNEDKIVFSRFFSRFTLMPFDQKSVILFSEQKSLLFNLNNYQLTPVYIQNVGAASFTVLAADNLPMFNVKRSNFDLNKFYYAISDDKLEELDLSYAAVVNNNLDTRVASINRDIYVHSLTDTYFNDCMIVACDGAIPAHKVIIANRLPKLLEQLDPVTNTIEMNELTMEEATILKQYIYTGTFSVKNGKSVSDIEKFQTLVTEHYGAEHGFESIDYSKFHLNDQYANIQWNFSKTEKSIKSHGVLWQAVSNFFRDLSDTCEDTPNPDGTKAHFTIDSMFENISEQVFDYIHRWIYTRENNLSTFKPDQILDVIEVAGLFGLELLLYQCEYYLVCHFAEFNFRTCVFVLDVAKRFAMRKLYNMAFDTICENTKSATVNDKKMLVNTVGQSATSLFIKISNELAYLRNYHNKKIKPHHHYQIPYEFIDNMKSPETTNIADNNEVNVALTNDNFLLIGDASEATPYLEIMSQQLGSKGAIWFKEVISEQMEEVELVFKFTKPIATMTQSLTIDVVMIPDGYMYLDCPNQITEKVVRQTLSRAQADDNDLVTVTFKTKVNASDRMYIGVIGTQDVNLTPSPTLVKFTYRRLCGN